MRLARRLGRLRCARVRAFVVLGRLMVRRALELLEPFAVRVDGVLRMLVVHDERVPANAPALAAFARCALRAFERAQERVSFH